MPLTPDDIYRAADELRGIASMGLHYAPTDYDRDRYERTLTVALRLFAQLEAQPFELVRESFRRDTWNYVSPVNGAEAWVQRNGKVHVVMSVFQIDAPEGEPVLSNETLGAGFFDEANLPEIDPAHARRVPLLFKLLRGEIPASYFDQPRRELM